MRTILEKAIIPVGFLVLIGTLVSVYLAVRLNTTGSGPVYVSFAQTESDADCALLCQENVAVMIDTGAAQDAENVLAMLDENGVQKLDYLILSVGEPDHIGGVKAVTSHVSVDKVIAPYYQGESEWDETIAYLKQNKIDIWYPTHFRTLRVGEMNMVVYPGLEKKYNKTSDYSLAVLITHHKVNMLFTGDATKKRSMELEMIHWPKTDLYKVPHHGRANSRTEELMELLKPGYAVVTAPECDSVISDCAALYDTKLLFTCNTPVRFVSDGEQLKPIE
ncbi:MAG: MBL fold metallo-hydrolase [Lachnospiraceae bacterium]|nr:MBL fold metallo-hydrolase [Lachnospiraceae bacterium]